MIQDCNISIYRRELSGILNQEVGIERLTQVATFPNGKLVDEVQPIFGPFCEFVLFIESVWHPFFRMLYRFLRGKEDRLFGILLASEKKTGHPLTYEEAFYFFRYISRHTDVSVRDILDVYNKCSHYTYNGILEAKGDLKKFKSALDDKGKDYQDLMKALQQLQYILIGVTGFPQKSCLYNKFNQWQYPHYDEFFITLDSDESSRFIKEKVKEFLFEYDNRPVIKRRYLNRRLTDFSYEDKQKLYATTSTVEGKYYPEWLAKLANISDPDSYLAEIVSREDEIIMDCDDKARRILYRAVGGHKTELISHFNIEFPKYDSPNGCNRYWEEYDWCNTDVFGDYIILYTKKMIDILGEVEDVVTDEEKKILQWILECSRYTRFFENRLTKRETDTPEVDISAPSVDSIKNDFSDYPGKLKNKRCSEKTEQTQIIKKYLMNLFKNGCEKQEEIRYVFFGEGKKIEGKLEYIHKKNELIAFVLYLHNGKGYQEMWDYLNKYICSSDGEFFKKNPRSNVPKQDIGEYKSWLDNCKKNLKGQAKWNTFY